MTALIAEQICGSSCPVHSLNIYVYIVYENKHTPCGGERAFFTILHFLFCDSFFSPFPLGCLSSIYRRAYRSSRLSRTLFTVTQALLKSRCWTLSKALELHFSVLESLFHLSHSMYTPSACLWLMLSWAWTTSLVICVGNLTLTLNK